MASSYPLAELRRLLQPATAQRGLVARLTGNRAEVATAKGLIIAQASAGLVEGQTVTVRNGTAYRAAVATKRYAV